MQNRSLFALLATAIAIAVGLAGTLLLRGTAWGVNLPIWVLLAGASAFGLLRKSDVTISRAAKWLALPIFAFSLCFFWRDSDALKIANGLALAIAIGVLVQRAHSGRPTAASVRDYSINLVKVWLWFTVDFAELVAKDIDWRKGSPSTSRLVGLIRGVLLAIPVLIVFGCLFSSADAVFSRSVIQAFSFDAVDAVTAISTSLLMAILIGGVIKRLCWPDKPTEPKRDTPRRDKPGLGVTEVVVAFGLIDALFALFVLVQLRYLFQGSDNVVQGSGLTYAEYARSGFFELVCAATLTVPVILGAHDLLATGERAVRRTFLGLSGVLVACVMVVLASALFRMRLYVEAYGLSELRLFTALFIGWLALTFIWLLITTITGKRSRFAFGALLAGYACVLGANYLNPDALIARTNLDDSHSPDLAYLSHLSLDAAPAIAASLQRLPPAQGRELEATVRSRWNDELKESDWRSLNLARLKYGATYRQRRGS